jgi:hypothetical protein
MVDGEKEEIGKPCWNSNEQKVVGGRGVGWTRESKS